MKRQPAMEQLPEIIYIGGVLHTLYTTPLLPWLRKLDSSSGFDIGPPTSSNAIMQRARTPTAERTENPAGTSRRA
jgi:hypothetical protein